MMAKLLNGKDHLSVAQSSRSCAASYFSEALREAKVWSNAFTFIPADKIKHNLVAVCSAQYAASLKSEIRSNTYARSSLMPRDVSSLASSLITQWNVSFNRLETPCLSYLYGSAKLHKSLFCLRFILGVSKKLFCDRFPTDAGLPVPSQSSASIRFAVV